MKGCELALAASHRGPAPHLRPAELAHLVPAMAAAAAGQIARWRPRAPGSIAVIDRDMTATTQVISATMFAGRADAEAAAILAAADDGKLGAGRPLRVGRRACARAPELRPRGGMPLQVWLRDEIAAPPGPR